MSQKIIRELDPKYLPELKLTKVNTGLLGKGTRILSFNRSLYYTWKYLPNFIKEYIRRLIKTPGIKEYLFKERKINYDILVSEIPLIQISNKGINIIVPYKGEISTSVTDFRKYPKTEEIERALINVEEEKPSQNELNYILSEAKEYEEMLKEQGDKSYVEDPMLGETEYIEDIDNDITDPSLLETIKSIINTVNDNGKEILVKELPISRLSAIYDDVDMTARRFIVKSTRQRLREAKKKTIPSFVDSNVETELDSTVVPLSMQSTIPDITEIPLSLQSTIPDTPVKPLTQDIKTVEPKIKLPPPTVKFNIPEKNSPILSANPFLNQLHHILLSDDINEVLMNFQAKGMNINGYAYKYKNLPKRFKQYISILITDPKIKEIYYPAFRIPIKDVVYIINSEEGKFYFIQPDKTDFILKIYNIATDITNQAFPGLQASLFKGDGSLVKKVFNEIALAKEKEKEKNSDELKIEDLKTEPNNNEVKVEVKPEVIDLEKTIYNGQSLKPTTTNEGGNLIENWTLPDNLKKVIPDLPNNILSVDRPPRPLATPGIIFQQSEPLNKNIPKEDLKKSVDDIVSFYKERSDIKMSGFIKDEGKNLKERLEQQGGTNPPDNDEIYKLLLENLRQSKVPAPMTPNAPDNKSIYHSITNVGIKRKYEDSINPEDIGYLPPEQININGSFKRAVTTNPQKMVFLTYESGIDHYYDCKMPLKINIPPGDFGMYRIIVNEVLFRKDMDLVADGDYIEFNMFPTTLASTTTPFIINAPFISSQNIQASFNYLTQNLLVEIIKQMLEDIIVPFSFIGVYINSESKEEKKEFNNLRGDEVIGCTLLPLNTNGIGIFIKTTVERSVTDSDGNTKKYIIDIDSQIDHFTISVSNRFRHIFPQLTTNNLLTSYSVSFNGSSVVEGVEFPWVNFGGPFLFMLNSSGQTTCPIANELGRQFNTAGLSYNPDNEPFGVIQMQSSLELVLKEGTEFRVWLMDNFGEYIRIKSPMYVQVTIAPFSNTDNGGLQ